MKTRLLTLALTETEIAVLEETLDGSILRIRDYVALHPETVIAPVWLEEREVLLRLRAKLRRAVKGGIEEEVQEASTQ